MSKPICSSCGREMERLDKHTFCCDDCERVVSDGIIRVKQRKRFPVNANYLRSLEPSMLPPYETPFAPRSEATEEWSLKQLLTSLHRRIRALELEVRLLQHSASILYNKSNEEEPA